MRPKRLESSSAPWPSVRPATPISGPLGALHRVVKRCRKPPADRTGPSHARVAVHTSQRRGSRGPVGSRPQPPVLQPVLDALVLTGQRCAGAGLVAQLEGLGLGRWVHHITSHSWTMSTGSRAVSKYQAEQVAQSSGLGDPRRPLCAPPPRRCRCSSPAGCHWAKATHRLRYRRTSGPGRSTGSGMHLQVERPCPHRPCLHHPCLRPSRIYEHVVYIACFQDARPGLGIADGVLR